MARKKRHDEKGSIYHVMSRGPMQRPMFTEPGAVRFFLSRLARQHRADRIRLFSYCVMDTHFHLVLQSVSGDMQGAMQRAESLYVRVFNRRHGRRGALAEDRYVSVEIKSTAHLFCAIAYGDMNPVVAGICSRAVDYPNSSASVLASGQRVPRWLDRHVVDRFLDAPRFGSERAAQYERTFHRVSDGALAIAKERIEARGKREDELSQLLWNTDAWRRKWLADRAKRADGVVTAAPSADWASISAAIDTETTSVELTRGRRSALQVAHAALLRELGGLSWSRIGDVMSISSSNAWSTYQRHKAESLVNGPYMDLVVRLAGRALQLCFGDGLSIQRARKLAAEDFMERTRRRQIVLTSNKGV